MKELSIEQKAQRHDEALERAKDYYDYTDSVADTELIEFIFPELKESEDERIMGKCIFEDVCDKSWCRLYSFECVDEQIYKPKTNNEQSKAKCSQCDKWGCSHRNLITDNCNLEKYETHITNKVEF